ncbi:MAG: ATP-binding protein [Anaerolineae bacterium]
MSNQAHLFDYNQPIAQKIAQVERSYLDQPNVTVAPPPWGQVVGGGHSLVRVKGLANFWEEHPETQFERYMEDLVTGLHGQRRPLAFLIIGREREIEVYLGVQGRAETEGKLLHTALAGSFPSVDAAVLEPNGLLPIRQALQAATGWVALTGTPTAKWQLGPERGEGYVQQIERLVRGLYGRRWCYLVCAQPISELTCSGYVNQMLVEIRNSSAHLKKSVQIAPGTTSEQVDREMQYYIELLEQYLERLRGGRAQGLWGVQTHLGAADTSTLQRGRALLQAVFAGPESRPEPLRALSCAPGQQEMPTPLNSHELATLTQLPREEMPGYAIKSYARFDVALSPLVGSDGVSLQPKETVNVGKVLDGETPTGNWYAIGQDDLAKHGLVVGVTGSGKTNTIFYLLDKLWKEGRVPFLVIEPAKTEYRDLRSAEGFQNLRVYTLGDERWAPFRLNPFEFEITDQDNRIHAQTHIDYLKSVFNAAFILYAPMPYVLEMCLHEIYRDKGWDLTTSQNRRLPPKERGKERHWPVFPTLTDLYHKIDEVVDRLGYEERIQMDVKAALKARVGSLRLGGKGLMLDTKASISMAEMLSQPTVLELERVGSDDEKAFLIGLILTRIYEYRIVEARGQELSSSLRHVTVFEEAHRLLKNVPTEVETEAANTKGQAVETFANMLSEIRAYGQGVLIAEQVPSKLAPDAIKNTNLKIMHRIVAEDDREVMGGSMNLDEAQERFVATLPTGWAAVYAEGADRPFLVQVYNYKGQSVAKRIKDAQVRGAMAKFCSQPLYDPLPGCSQYCQAKKGNNGRCDSHVRDLALSVIAHSEFPERFARYFLSLLEEPKQAVFGYNDLARLLDQVVRLKPAKKRPVALCVILHALDDLFDARGRQYSWFYNVVSTLRDQLTAVLHTITEGFENKQDVLTNLAAQSQRGLEQFQKGYQQQCARAPVPYAGCSACQAKCRCRYEVARLVKDKALQRDFVGAIQNTTDDSEMWKRLGDVCLEAARRAIVVSDEAITKGVALCYVAQMGPALGFGSGSQRKMVNSMRTVLGAQ